MNKEEIIALQKVGEKYTREYMFKMLRERGNIIDEAMESIDEHERATEDVSLEEYFDEHEYEIGNSGNNKVRIKKTVKDDYMDAKKILELQQMSKQYTREEMLKLNEDVTFEPVGGIEDDLDEDEELFSGGINSSKVLELQRISKLYTREKMFKMNEERKDVMRKRDEYLNAEEDDYTLIGDIVSEIINNDIKVKVKK